MAAYSEGWNVVYIILLVLAILSFALAALLSRYGIAKQVGLVSVGLALWAAIGLIEHIRAAAAS